MQKNIDVKSANNNDLLLPKTTLDNIENKQSGFYADTENIGFADAIKYLSLLTIPLKNTIAIFKNNSFEALGITEYRWTFPGYIKFTNGYAVLFGTNGSAPVNSVTKVVYPFQLKSDYDPIAILTGNFDKPSHGQNINVYRVKKDSQNNVCDLTRELWFCRKKIDDGTDSNLGTVNYFVLGRWK